MFSSHIQSFESIFLSSFRLDNMATSGTQDKSKNNPPSRKRCKYEIKLCGVRGGPDMPEEMEMAQTSMIETISCPKKIAKWYEWWCGVDKWFVNKL